jgi:hypothetical protein
MCRGAIRTATTDHSGATDHQDRRGFPSAVDPALKNFFFGLTRLCCGGGVETSRHRKRGNQLCFDMKIQPREVDTNLCSPNRILEMCRDVDCSVHTTTSASLGLDRLGSNSRSIDLLKVALYSRSFFHMCQCGQQPEEHVSLWIACVSRARTEIWKHGRLPSCAPSSIVEGELMDL